MVLPNQLTTLRIILTPVFLFLFLSGDSLYMQISLAVYIIAAITDWYDGWLARKFDYITTWGKFMDPLADKILTSTAFFAFVFIDVLSLWMVIIVVFRDLFVTGLRLFAEWQKKSFTTSRLAKIKTVVQMLFIFYLLIVFTLKENEFLKNQIPEVIKILTNSTAIYFTMLAITIFTFTTGVIYIYQNRVLISRLFSKSDEAN
ncbi:MAG: CDP-diacylglycerol--glycerol-3-phosphate 3-phosphatidyltransferase [Ignavibacteriae bacterium]|nr:CDP-diacylglycerol--glycerol-3-phosphate 3-phosphatidyltransferase [Ignavibacteriota bacterium]MCB9206871.1 CDP-diacylglycerol--glycerol-3-phosphate 3-phosphatidyltransferase [Ignavibacteriales bacterium]MCB9218936.1 CDP-diacylglycerol--glycerol-3-phosphate 3-phosphatidyltransferase [Ignavibacteriales bacterium]